MQRCLAVIVVTSTVALLAPLSASAARNHCEGINRAFPNALVQRFTTAVQRQFNDPQADVPQLFRFRDWAIAYVNFTTSDPGYVFYRGDPLRNRYVTIWGGAAGYNEEDEIRIWTEQNARGIPERLAACFAYHVTKDRDL